MKKLQFGSTKCHKMHVGDRTRYCPKLTVDNWEVKVVDDLFTGDKVLTDEYNGEHIMEASETEKYLGDLISRDGKNGKNIHARKAKGTGIVDQIISILDGTVFGPFHFEVALILRSSLLLNGILTNSEAWYGLKTSDLEQLEEIVEQLLRKILEVGAGCPKEMLYLETGTIPIRFLLAFKRVMFLHYILNQDKDSLIYRIFEAQVRNPSKNDWSETVKQDLEELGIENTFSQIKSLQQDKFRSVVRKAIEEKTYRFLTNLKLKHSKVKHIEHKSLVLQEYLQPRNVQSIQLSKFLFQSRTRMLECRVNFRNRYKNEDLLCPLKCGSLDDQKHILECSEIDVNAIIDQEIPEYEDLFGNDVKKQTKVASILQNKYRKRKKMTS